MGKEEEKGINMAMLTSSVHAHVYTYGELKHTYIYIIESILCLFAYFTCLLFHLGQSCRCWALILIAFCLGPLPLITYLLSSIS